MPGTTADEVARELSDGQILDLLQQMGDYDFEHFVAGLWERQGWEVSVRQQSGDEGVDVDARMVNPVETTAGIQAKRYAEGNPISPGQIREYNSLKQQEGVDSVVVVTTNRFTSGAHDRAEELNVKCVDGQELVGLVRELEAYDLLADYAPVSLHAGHHDVSSSPAAGSLARRLGQWFGHRNVTTPSGGLTIAGLLLVPVKAVGAARWVGILYLAHPFLFWAGLDPLVLPALSGGSALLLLTSAFFLLPVAIYADAKNSNPGRATPAGWAVWSYFIPGITPTLYVYLRFVKPNL